MKNGGGMMGVDNVTESIQQHMTTATVTYKLMRFPYKKNKL